MPETTVDTRTDQDFTITKTKESSHREFPI
jgi:hypothetical protein